MYSDEKNALLKYFYFIDTERLAEKVKNELSQCDSIEPDEIFQSMFTEISEACKRYIEFIYSADSFNYTDSRNDSNAPALGSIPSLTGNHSVRIILWYCQIPLL